MRGNKKTALVMAVASMIICVMLFAFYGREFEVSVSKESGFYNEPFELSLTSPKGTIYYTLDGSEPDEHAIRYDGPIEIKDASLNENTISMRQDLSVDFYEEVHNEKNFFTWGYKLPDFLIDKCTVIKAAAIDGQGNKSDTVTKVYFVDYQNKTAYDHTNVMCIVTDPDNLFDYKKGIYVTGKVFDDVYHRGKIYYGKGYPEIITENKWACSNYTCHGKRWERPARVTIFDQNKQILLDGSYGIRIQGGVSRNMLPKSLNIFARKVYGNTKLPGKLMHLNYALDSVNLNSGAQSMPYNLPDYLVNRVTKELGIGTRQYLPYQMFLNGEYWGYYWLIEKYDENYFKDNYKIDKDNILMVKNKAIELGSDMDKKYYQDFENFVVKTDLSIQENFDRFCEMADLESCVNYYATEIYIANDDWQLKNNYALWRAKEPGGQLYGDGKWRWLIFDVNLALKYDKVKLDTEYFEENDPFLKSLMANETFRQMLSERLLYMADEVFAPDKMYAMIDDYQQTMRGAIENSANRFWGSDNQYVQNYDAYFDLMCYFFRDRNRIIKACYDEDGLHYNYGDPITFMSTDNTAASYVGEGFDMSELYFTWSTGHVARMKMKVDEPEHDLCMRVHAAAYDSIQRIQIAVNGEIIFDHQWHSEEENEIIIPKELVQGHEALTIEFLMPESRSPVDVEGVPDYRTLGLRFMDMDIKEIP